MSKFIVVEGLEGAGKTTAIEVIKSSLTQREQAFICTREPGGTDLAEKMRAIVKEPTDEKLTDEAELLLMYAARVQLVENVIKPALEQGNWVIGDRHDMSSLAYQGGGRQIADELIYPIRQAVLKGFEPDLTILMDLPPEVGLARAAARGELDRIEQEQIDFFQRTRQAYLALAKDNNKVAVIDASQSLENVHKQLSQVMTDWLAKHG